MRTSTVSNDSEPPGSDRSPVPPAAPDVPEEIEVDDVEAILSPLREVALDHDPAGALDGRDRKALRRAGHLLVKRPGWATRLLLLALEARAHEHVTENRHGREVSHG